MVQDDLHNSRCACSHITCQGFMGPEVSATRILSPSLWKRKALSKLPELKRCLLDKEVAGVAAFKFLCTMSVTSASLRGGGGKYSPDLGSAVGSPVKSPQRRSTTPLTPDRTPLKRGDACNHPSPGQVSAFHSLSPEPTSPPASPIQRHPTPPTREDQALSESSAARDETGDPPCHSPCAPPATYAQHTSLSERLHSLGIRMEFIATEQGCDSFFSALVVSGHPYFKNKLPEHAHHMLTLPILQLDSVEVTRNRDQTSLPRQ